MTEFSLQHDHVVCKCDTWTKDCCNTLMVVLSQHRDLVRPSRPSGVVTAKVEIPQVRCAAMAADPTRNWRVSLRGKAGDTWWRTGGHSMLGSGRGTLGANFAPGVSYPGKLWGNLGAAWP